MNQLDLSKFPKIVHPSELENSEQITKRSITLNAIKEVSENLINLMNSFIIDLSSFDSKAVYLNNREVELREAEYSVAQKEKEVYRLREEIEKEKEYIVIANQDLKVRESEMKDNKIFLAEIEESKKDWEERKTLVLKAENALAEKQNKLNADQKQLELDKEAMIAKQVEVEEFARNRQRSLDIIQENLGKKELLLNQREVVDADRKKLLDLREKKIKDNETQNRKELDAVA